MCLRICLCFLTILGSLYASGGRFRFASYYGDHMVLQKAPERAVLWGYGPDDTEVTVFLSGGPVTNNAPAVSVAAGIWRVTLDPMEAGGPYNVTVVFQNNHSITLTDVLFGDVWLCGGQSNMAFTTSQVFNASEELALASKFPQVRIFMAALEQSYTELTDLAGVEVPWSVPTAKLLGGGDFKHYSAVCWIFGRHLYKALKYPIGLVTSCWGGTPVEAWSSPRALQHCDLDRINGIPMPYTPSMYLSVWTHSVLWNAMIHPLLNMTIKGAIWYQGEANTDYNQKKYSCSFPSMIDDWRMAFHQSSGRQTSPDFPFGFVQVSTYRKASLSEGFPNIRWHQTADYGFAPNLRMKNTFMAVAMDLGDEMSPFGSIHPRDKQDVAYRLSLGARAVAYGEEGVSFQGPFPSRVLVNDQYINVTYDQRVSVTQSKDIFQICCSVVRAPCDSLSLWVPAPILQWGVSAVQVSTNYCSMDNVAGLRYAWRDWPCDFKACPVYSADGVLPAPPFTLNRWPDKQ
ncbi:sialate O-acetylesterase isoform X1 [Salmo trutta]|uniref:Sialic acid acetylesterase n=1 Tax=Salmo trutta TaxID=8032 RepID=A0A674EM56_SALTR|nr:sialate O-acetylesterase-like isoform X1 [Salmo trutta]